MTDEKKIIDDSEILLNVDKIKPASLLEILKSVHLAIQFTMEVSENNLQFLDIIIRKNGNKIWMDIYSKPTDSKRYVPFNSNHSKNCLKTYPFA